jgi:hypothetical protein
MQKQRLQLLLEAFPDNVDLDELFEKALVLEKLEMGERQIAAGETTTHEHAK